MVLFSCTVGEESNLLSCFISDKSQICPSQLSDNYVKAIQIRDPNHVSQFDCSQVVSIVSFGELNNKGFNLKTPSSKLSFQCKIFDIFQFVVAFQYGCLGRQRGLRQGAATGNGGQIKQGFVKSASAEGCKKYQILKRNKLSLQFKLAAAIIFGFIISVRFFIYQT